MEKANTKPNNSATYLNGMLMLPSIDLELHKLKGENGVQVIDTLALVPELAKSIE